ncbi:MAG: hypothetical protein ACLTSZ_05040 [Lachnospiraceae bacterium]
MRLLRIQKTAQAVAQVGCRSSLSAGGGTGQLCAVRSINEKGVIDIKDGRTSGGGKDD